MHNLVRKSLALPSTIRHGPFWVQARPFTKFDSFINSPIPARKQRFIPTSGTYPKSFKVGSINAAIHPANEGRPDLVLVASEVPSNGAAVFTKHEFPASSIVVTKELVQRTKGRGLTGIIANAGCANVWTGQAGLEDARAMSREANKYMEEGAVGGREEQPSVMVMHTGAGGMRLPIDKIFDKLPQLHASLGSDHDHWYEAARGILTTDTFPKMLSHTFTLPSFPGSVFSISGITKGAGMIHPNMATTLGIICTDAPVSAPALQQLLSVAANKSYNCISIEGDTSTNDMVAMLANGAAITTNDTNSHSASISEVEYDSGLPKQSQDFVSLQSTLISFMASLAKLVVRDGEGATKFITIRVRNSPSYPAAHHIASRIARSVLLKTATYGSQTGSWGNVLAAVGYAVIDLPPEAKDALKPGEKLLISELTSIGLVKNPVDAEYPNEDRGPEQILRCVEKGQPLPDIDEEEVKKIMEKEDVEIVVDLRDDGGSKVRGETEEAVYWTCDLTHDFVTVNGDFPK